MGPPPSAWTQMDTVSAPSFPQSGPDRHGRFSLGFLLSSAEEHPSRPGGFTSSSAGGPWSLQLTLPFLPPPSASLPPWPALSPVTSSVTSLSPGTLQQGQNNSVFPRRVG